nr:hypothetical protein [Spirochaetales bacterium]
TFDVVIMDMTDPFGPSKLLYTREFYQAVKTSFRNEAGIFVMHSESPIARPTAFTCIRKTLREVFHQVETLYPFIQMYGTLWSICLSSDTLKPTKIVPEMINNRIEELGLKDLHLITGESIKGMAIEYPYLSEILKGPASIITDSAPDFPDAFMQEA